jgi:hypothetical protein
VPLRLGQFLFRLRALQKQTCALFADERLGQLEQLAQRRTGPRRHHVRRDPGHLLDPLGMDGDPVHNPAIKSDLAQEGALALIGIQEMDPAVGRGGEDQSGEAGPGAEVYEDAAGRREQGQELGAVQKVAVPEVGQGGRADQVDLGLPFHQQSGVDLQPLQCFT